MTSKPIVQVALATPLRRCFDYLAQNQPIPTGSRISVPFGYRTEIMGIAVGASAHSETAEGKLKGIHKVLDNEPVLNPHLLELCQWCADYYHFPMGEVCHMALPALLRKPKPMPTNTLETWQLTASGQTLNIDELSQNARNQRAALTHLQNCERITSAELKSAHIQKSTLKKLAAKGWLEQRELKEHYPAHQLPKNILKQTPLTLTDEQKDALSTITLTEFKCYLLEGVTGSGKTEVYLQAIEQVLQHDKQVLVLVPEIGLTPQTLARFEARFDLPIAALHSGLNDKQRFQIWQQAYHQQLRIVIGTRSSIFTPLDKLGLIIVDEEHDLSYKQQEGVRYSARDVAIVRAKMLNIPIIMGSATPSLESLSNALNKRYHHLQLQQRSNKAPMPSIECVAATRDKQEQPMIQEAIRQALDKGQQVLVFINRRGYAPTLICADCGWISECQNCDSRMTLHRRQHLNQYQQWLHCHSCDTKTHIPTQCPYCHSQKLQALGAGTQRSEDDLNQLFPQVPIFRIDRDSMAAKGQLQSTLDEINTGKPCILVGTQMLAKGHHFAKLGLAVILGLDSAFFSGDFRGSERMGQLLIQVAGRVGREQQYQEQQDQDQQPGRVLIQTNFADHPLLQQLINEGYRTLAETLIAERKHCAMPPWEHLALIRCHAQQAAIAYEFLQRARAHAEKILPPRPGLQYLGPFPANPEKRNNRYHALLQIKTNSRGDRQHVLDKLCVYLEKAKQAKGLHWLVDVDPLEF